MITALIGLFSISSYVMLGHELYFSCIQSLSRAHVPTYLESLASHGLRDHVIICQHVLPPQ